MDSQSTSTVSAPTTSSGSYSEFLEQAKLAQAALKSLLIVLQHKDSERDDAIALFVINKAIKATVRHCLCYS